MGATYSLTTRIKSRSFMPKEAKSNSSARSERKYSSRSEARRSSSGDDCLDCSMNELTLCQLSRRLEKAVSRVSSPARERHLLSATYSCPGANDCPAPITALSKVSPRLFVYRYRPGKTQWNLREHAVGVLPDFFRFLIYAVACVFPFAESCLYCIVFVIVRNHVYCVFCHACDSSYESVIVSSVCACVILDKHYPRTDLKREIFVGRIG